MSLLASQLAAVDAAMPFGVAGRVQSISGLTIEAADLPVPIGSFCKIESFNQRITFAEVIGFAQETTLLMPLNATAGVARGDRVVTESAAPRVWCSPQLLGRVLDGFGRPNDGGPALHLSESRRIDGRSVHPLARENIRQPISTGIRAIDGLHTCGLGQRMGIFSGPGVGKSTLMSAIAKNTSADISVIALIGERGREVKEFIENALGKEGLKRCVVVASAGDDTPLLKVRAARVACTICEYFRDQGKHVLLLMDSLTRLAQAQRQIGLAAREPPATKGFPPSVFALLPEILERAGKTPTGSITGFYTVLVEGDDFNEPIPDAVKGISDGHLWLNRALAVRGHYPALDPIQSISRVRGDVVEAPHAQAAVRILALLGLYEDIEDLVTIGAYVPGQSFEHDLAVQSRTRILEYLKQDTRVPSSVEAAKKQLFDLSAWIDGLERALRVQQQQALKKGGAAQR